MLAFTRLAMSMLGMLGASNAMLIATLDGFEKIHPTGYVVGVSPIMWNRNTTMESCALACLSDSVCGGFNWHAWDYGCQLEPVDYATASATGHWTIDAYGFWVFYSKLPRQH
eukprot:1927945-Amphidinium_carterae.1